MEQEKKPGPPRIDPDAVVARDDVHVERSPLRCPYCHVDVKVEGGDWVACASCLARHHRGCWAESPRCGACGRDRALDETRSATSPPSTSAARRLAALALVAIVALALLAVVWVRFVQRVGAALPQPPPPTEAEPLDRRAARPAEALPRAREGPTEPAQATVEAAPLPRAALGAPRAPRAERVERGVFLDDGVTWAHIVGHELNAGPRVALVGTLPVLEVRAEALVLDVGGSRRELLLAGVPGGLALVATDGSIRAMPLGRHALEALERAVLTAAPSTADVMRLVTTAVEEGARRGAVRDLRQAPRPGRVDVDGAVVLIDARGTWAVAFAPAADAPPRAVIVGRGQLLELEGELVRFRVADGERQRRASEGRDAVTVLGATSGGVVSVWTLAERGPAAFQALLRAIREEPVETVDLEATLERLQSMGAAAPPRTPAARARAPRRERLAGGLFVDDGRMWAYVVVEPGASAPRAVVTGPARVLEVQADAVVVESSDGPRRVELDALPDGWTVVEGDFPLQRFAAAPERLRRLLAETEGASLEELDLESLVRAVRD